MFKELFTESKITFETIEKLLQKGDVVVTYKENNKTKTGLVIDNVGSGVYVDNLGNLVKFSKIVSAKNGIA